MNIEAKAGEVRSMDNEAMLDTAFLYGANAAYIEQLYAQYAEDPASVPESWQRFFRGVADPAADATHATPDASQARLIAMSSTAPAGSAGESSTSNGSPTA
jgi:2-oxoglutarate dehydrogenase E1 component